MRGYGRWYGAVGVESSKDQPRGVVQVDHQIRDPRYRDGKVMTLPETVLRLAQAEYERQYGDDQDYERMQQRGGLSILEVVGLLADYVERLNGKPTVPRKKTL